MNYELNKKGLIYKAMDRHRKKNIRYCLTVLAVLVIYFFSFKPYITAAIFGSTPLDTEKFSADASVSKLSVQKNADGEISQVINSKVLKKDSYWQGDSYKFRVKLSDVEKPEIKYTTINTNENESEDNPDPETSAVIYVADIGGIDTIVIAYPHIQIEDRTEVEGIFAPVAPVISYDLINTEGYSDREYFNYVLDTRGIEMENEGFDLVMCIILVAIILFLLVKIVIQYIKPLSTPTYRNLEKYGDLKSVCEDVEAQLTAAGVTRVKKKHPAVTSDWIVSEEPFKLNIVKNHTKPQDSSRYGSRL